ncbi:MAG: orotidine-5'-phosphate decarboxylase [Candidatus Gracilibacteria bacterium]
MHPTLAKLRKIMEEKQTNLCVAADVVLAEEVLELAEMLGEKICIFKTHVDILRDFTPEFTEKLQEIARRKNFLIFEDRKFADIGNTVSLQFSEGIYKIAEWADFINAHTIVGEGIIQGLAKANQKSGLILLAQMTPKGNLFSESYALKTVEMAKAYPDFVVGFIGSSDRPEALAKIRAEAGEDLLILTPGIQLATGGDDLGQTYNTPEKAIGLGADVIIVGRGITGAENPVAEAEKYREAGWVASRK